MLLGDVNVTFVRSIAAAIMIWYLVAVGIHRLCGNHVNVSHMLVDAVAGVQMLYQR